ncbi:hypothetical protein KGQ34_01495 [Patescibacteria group bacterium]|nr:hypothetical protein [Patescibacteria group bacterium]
MDFDEFFKKLPEFKEHAGDVFYDPKTNRFIQVRGLHDDYVACGGFTIFYEDARTNKSSQQLSHEYVDALVKITCIDKTDFAFFDRFGWKVKEKTE